MRLPAPLRWLNALREDIAFSRDPELARSLRDADARLHDGETVPVEDLRGHVTDERDASA